MPYFKEACAWAGRQPGLEVALLVGHWDHADAGALGRTGSVPGAYEAIRGLKGCAALDARRALKHMYGHTHCNRVHENGGMMVAGMGMDGCGNCERAKEDHRAWHLEKLRPHEPRAHPYVYVRCGPLSRALSSILGVPVQMAFRSLTPPAAASASSTFRSSPRRLARPTGRSWARPRSPRSIPTTPCIAAS